MSKLIKKGCDLQSCMFCRQSIASWRPAIEAHRTCLQYKKGETLFKEGDEVKGMYFIEKGLVKVHKHWAEGKEVILRFGGNGDIVGHRGLGNDPIYPVTATVLEPTKVCFVDIDFFNETLKVNPDFLYKLMMFFAAELKESEKKMRNLTHMAVKGRIANAILTLYQRFGLSETGSLNINISRQDFSSYIGAAYETVFRVMNEMETEGAIRTDGKKIFIKAEPMLHEYMKS